MLTQRLGRGNTITVYTILQHLSLLHWIPFSIPKCGLPGSSLGPMVLHIFLASTGKGSLSTTLKPLPEMFLKTSGKRPTFNWIELGVIYFIGYFIWHKNDSKIKRYMYSSVVANSLLDSQGHRPGWVDWWLGEMEKSYMSGPSQMSIECEEWLSKMLH